MDEDDEYKGHVLTADVDDAGVCDGDDAGDDVIIINLNSSIMKKSNSLCKNPKFMKIPHFYSYLKDRTHDHQHNHIHPYSYL